MLVSTTNDRETSMKSSLYTLMALVFFTVFGIMMETKMSKFTHSAIMACIYAMTLPMAIFVTWTLRAYGQPVTIPIGWELAPLLIGLGIAYFFGDFFYIGAFTSGGSAVSVTTIITLLPVSTAMAMWIISGNTPNWYQIGSFFFAAIAVALAIKGNSL
jgi:drug/metabolite transporter (DMT)-like permease